MKYLGLTGMFGSGKTTVARLLSAKGAVVLDADDYARQLTEPPSPLLAEIKKAFGADFFTSEGALDRRKLGGHVFARKEELDRLTAILHPAIQKLHRSDLEKIAAETPAKIVIYSAPLLFEVGIYRKTLKNILVLTDPKIAEQRLTQFRGYSAAEIAQRNRHFWPLEEKINLADYSLNNSGSLDETEKQLAVIWQKILDLP